MEAPVEVEYELRNTRQYGWGYITMAPPKFEVGDRVRTIHEPGDKPRSEMEGEILAICTTQYGWGYDVKWDGLKRTTPSLHEIMNHFEKI